MAMRNVGTYGIAGILVAILVIAGIVVSGLELPGFQSQGTLVVKLTDEPVELEHLNLTITSLAVQKADENAEDGGWIPLSFVDDTTSVYVDILALQNLTRDLSVVKLDPGNYTKLRMSIQTANATYVDGTIVDLFVPPNQIDVIVHFEIEVGETTTLLVDMTGHISETNQLSPVLKAMVV